MKTTELYIEQVIIGLLVLTIAAAPWARELVGQLGEINIKEISVFLGLAFLLGIPFDRFADTLSDRLERHHRLQFALDNWKGNPMPKIEDNKLDQDIFPEDALRLKGLREKDAVVNWIEYHRSRIRLARALAVYGPALTLSLTLAMSRKVSGGMSPDKIYTLLGAVAAGYVVWGIIANPPTKLREKINEYDGNPPDRGGLVRLLRALFSEQLPRTDQRRFLDYAKKWYEVDQTTNTLREEKRGGLRVWSDEWRSLVVPVLVLLAALWFGIEYGSKPNSKTAWVAGGGVLLTVISTWSWWRISTTYRSYLYDIGSKKPLGVPI